MISPTLTMGMSCIDMTTGLGYSAKTVKILEGSVTAVTVWDRPGDTLEKKLYIDIKNGYPNPDPTSAEI